MSKLPVSARSATRPFIPPTKKDRYKRYFFVDYENVHEQGLDGLDQLKSDDYVMIFYSKFVDAITFETHRALMETKAKVEIVKVLVGSKNALDFQLSSNLGYFINFNTVAKRRGCKYYIVSSDNGYSVLCPFWEQFGAKVMTVSSLMLAKVAEPKSYSEVLAALGLSEEEEHAVGQFIEADLHGSPLHDAIQRTIKPADKATAVYRAVKDYYTKIPKQPATVK